MWGGGGDGTGLHGVSDDPFCDHKVGMGNDSEGREGGRASAARFGVRVCVGASTGGEHWMVLCPREGAGICQLVSWSVLNTGCEWQEWMNLICLGEVHQ